MVCGRDNPEIGTRRVGRLFAISNSQSHLSGTLMIIVHIVSGRNALMIEHGWPGGFHGTIVECTNAESSHPSNPVVRQPPDNTHARSHCVIVKSLLALPRSAVPPVHVMVPVTETATLTRPTYPAGPAVAG